MHISTANLAVDIRVSYETRIELVFEWVLQPAMAEVIKRHGYP